MGHLALSCGQCVHICLLQCRPQVLCGQPVCSRADPTHCVSRFIACKMYVGLTCSACCLQHVATGLITTNHHSRCLNLSGTLL